MEPHLFVWARPSSGHELAKRANLTRPLAHPAMKNLLSCLNWRRLWPTPQKAHPAIRSYGRIHGRLTRAQKNALSQKAEHWLIPPLGQDKTTDLRRCFATDQPLVLDLGCGMCDTLADLARNNRTENYLGVDVYQPGIARGINLIDQYQLSNVRLIQQDLSEVLARGLPPHSVAKIYVLFPDPWPKRKHHKRRLIQAEFLRTLHGILQPGGQLLLATDWADYADHIAKQIQEAGCFKILDQTTRFPITPTKFERRAQKLDHVIRWFECVALA